MRGCLSCKSYECQKFRWLCKTEPIKPSGLLTLTNSVWLAAARTADVETTLRLSCFLSKQTSLSEVRRRPASYNWLWTSFPGLFSFPESELPACTYIRVTSHTHQAHLHRISSRMLQSFEKRICILTGHCQLCELCKTVCFSCLSSAKWTTRTGRQGGKIREGSEWRKKSRGVMKFGVLTMCPLALK